MPCLLFYFLLYSGRLGPSKSTKYVVDDHKPHHLRSFMTNIAG